MPEELPFVRWSARMLPVAGPIVRLLSVVVVLLLCSLPLAAQAPSWVHAIGGGSRFGNDHCFHLRVDQEANSYLLVQFSDTLRFDSITVPAVTASDLLVAKLDRSERLLWYRTIHGTQGSYPHGLGLTEEGTLYAAVSVFGDADFGDTVVAASGSNELVVSYDLDGALRWVRSVANVSSGYVGTIAAARGGGCAIAFPFGGNLLVDSTLLTSPENADAAVIRLDSAGNILWARSFGGNLTEYPESIAIDGTGGVYVAGVFSSASIHLDSMIVRNAAVLPQYLGSTDVFIAAFNADGTGRYLRSAGDIYQDYLSDIAVDPDGNLYAVGTFATRMRFGDVSLDGTSPGCGFVSSYDRTGALRWARSFCGDSSVFVAGIALDYSSAQVGEPGAFLTGCFSKAAMFGDVRLESRGDLDAFAARISSVGTVDVALSAGGAGSDFGRAVAVDGHGGCVIAGEYSGSTNGTVTTGATFGADTIYSNGKVDFFVARLGVPSGVDVSPRFTYGSPVLGPNPAHDRTWLSFDLDHAAPVRAEIVDELGAVRSVPLEDVLAPGTHRLPIDVAGLVSGLYFCRLTIGGAPSRVLPVVVR